MRKKIMKFHKTECNKAVEPRIGKLLNDVLVTLEPDLADDFQPPSVKRSRIRIGVTIDISKVAALLCLTKIVVAVDTESLQRNLNLLFKIFLCPYGVGL